MLAILAAFFKSLRPAHSEAAMKRSEIKVIRGKLETQVKRVKQVSQVRQLVNSYAVALEFLRGSL